MEAARDVRTRDDLEERSVVGELPGTEALAEVGVEVDGGHPRIVQHVRRALQRLRLSVRASPIHGRGVFARLPLAAGTELLEYTGELVTWQVAAQRYEDSDAPAGHTFFFDVGDGLVIDGGRGGNASRWINHSCEPNCEFELVGRRVVVRALTDIAAGDELLLDYRLELDDADARDQYACRCGAPTCRATMVGPS